MLNSQNFSVILVRPRNAENIGLAARCMSNTGFQNLRIAGLNTVPPSAYRTAVHSGGILDKALLFPDLSKAAEDLNIILAAVARTRKYSFHFTLEEAVGRVERYSENVTVGLVFGNERTGLSKEELRQAHFLFTLPQASVQPSYNLASAVLLTLFALFNRRTFAPVQPRWAKPLSQGEQQECIKTILKKLRFKGFIHRTNEAHVTDMVHSLFGRIVLTEKDKKLLLAMFSKGVESGDNTPDRDEEKKTRTKTTD